MLPRISVVMPSFNPGRFLEEAIKSVLVQNYPDLELIIIDGGSTDGSVDVIHRFDSEIAYWVSEPDQGLYDALNKGFAQATGEVMAWLSADDKFTPWALNAVGGLFGDLPEVDWVTSLFPLFWNEHGIAVRCEHYLGFTRAEFMRGEALPGRTWYARSWLQLESTFWRESLWHRAGGCFDDSMQAAGDFDLWARFFELEELYGVETPLGGFRRHGNQLSVRSRDLYYEEALTALRRVGGSPPSKPGSVYWRIAHAAPPSLRRSLRLTKSRPYCRYLNGRWVIERAF